MTTTVINLKNPTDKLFVDQDGKRIKNPPKLSSYKCSIILCMLDAATRESFSRMLREQLDQLHDKGERIDELHVMPAALPKLLAGQAVQAIDKTMAVFSGEFGEGDQDVLPALRKTEVLYPAAATALLSRHLCPRMAYCESTIQADVLSINAPGMLFYTSVLPRICEIYRKIKAPLRSNNPRAQNMLDHYNAV